MKDAFQTSIRAALSRNAPLEEHVAILVAHKDQGLAQAIAYEALEELRSSAPDEATEDRILEVMDLVVGFCSPQARVWPEPYQP